MPRTLRIAALNRFWSKPAAPHAFPRPAARLPALLAQRGEPIRDLRAFAGQATAASNLRCYTRYDSSARRAADTLGGIFSEET